MPRITEKKLPLPVSGDLAFMKGFVSPEIAAASVNDLRQTSSIKPGDRPLAFDTVWHQRMQEDRRSTEGVSQLTGNSRLFVAAQVDRLVISDIVLEDLGSELRLWNRFSGYVRMLGSGVKKTVGVDGVRDARVLIATGPTTLHVGRKNESDFGGFSMPMDTGDAAVINNLCDPGEQSPYGIEVPVTTASQALLYFSFTEQ